MLGGSQLGSALIDWAARRARAEGRKWLRLDAWTTNTALQAYYQRLGFEHVRTVTDDGIVSGALFQRDASVTLDFGPAVSEATR